MRSMGTVGLAVLLFLVAGLPAAIWLLQEKSFEFVKKGAELYQKQ